MTLIFNETIATNQSYVRSYMALKNRYLSLGSQVNNVNEVDEEF